MACYCNGGVSPSSFFVEQFEDRANVFVFELDHDIFVSNIWCHLDRRDLPGYVGSCEPCPSKWYVIPTFSANRALFGSCLCFYSVLFSVSCPKTLILVDPRAKFKLTKRLSLRCHPLVLIPLFGHVNSTNLHCVIVFSLDR